MGIDLLTNSYGVKRLDQAKDTCNEGQVTTLIHMFCLDGRLVEEHISEPYHRGIYQALYPIL